MFESGNKIPPGMLAGMKISNICQAVAVLVLQNHLTEKELKDHADEIEKQVEAMKLQSPALWERDGKRMVERGRKRIKLIQDIEKFFNEEIQEDRIEKENRIELV